MATRLCRICNKNEFEMTSTWKHHYCRDCYREMDRRRYYKSKEKRLEKDNKRYARLTPEQKRQRYLTTKARSPEKLKARAAVHNAVYLGKLKKLPCEVCGAEPSHAHHKAGYDKENWFNIAWLCKQHHYEQHRKYDVGS